MKYIFRAYDHTSHPTVYHLYDNCSAGAGMEPVVVDEDIIIFHGILPDCRQCLRRKEREEDDGA